MAKVSIDTLTLSSIGDAIRGKEESSELIPVNDMATRITNLPSGGGSCELPEDQKVVYTIEAQDDRYHTSEGQGTVNLWTLMNIAHATISIKSAFGINTLASLFSGLSKEIPDDVGNITIDIDANSVGGALDYKMPSISNGDQGEYGLKKPFRFTRGSLYNKTYYPLFDFAKIEYFPEDYFDNWTTSGGIHNILANNQYLRKTPHVFYDESKPLVFKPGTSWYDMNSYLNCFDSAYSLEDIHLVYPEDSATSQITSTTDFPSGYNHFNLSHYILEAPHKQQLKNKPNCKNVKISLGGAGTMSANDEKYFIDTILKGYTKVIDDITYQQVKDSGEDWYTTDVNYAKYNYASALETINTMVEVVPGNKNIITFNKLSGSKTDGGAVGNLTPEEIAIVANKGWTVAFEN